jgi:hypothetical protein
MDPPTATRITRVHFPKNVSACMSNIPLMHAEDTIDHRCVVVQGWRQNPASSLSHCMERQHDFDGTAADPRMPRRLYDLALNQETVTPSANISGAIIPMTAQLTWRPQFGSFGFMCEISRFGMHYPGRKSPLPSFFNFCHICKNLIVDEYWKSSSIRELPS